MSETLPYRATKGMVTSDWKYRSADPLTPIQIKMANDILKGVDSSEEGFINGLQGLGNVLSAAASAGEAGLMDVWVVDQYHRRHPGGTQLRQE